MKFLKRFLKTLALLLIGIAAGATLYALAPQLMRTTDDEPPVNLVVVSDRIHTSGQPSAAQIAGLRAGGYELVVNLAPPQVVGSIRDEGGLVAETGLYYVNIPVDWHRPRRGDFDFFSEVLSRSQARRVLVHCQVNYRASLFTFLYRVVHEGADPEAAYDNVSVVWAPDPHWLEFASDILARHGIEYEFL